MKYICRKSRREERDVVSLKAFTRVPHLAVNLCPRARARVLSLPALAVYTKSPHTSLNSWRVNSADDAAYNT